MNRRERIDADFSLGIFDGATRDRQALLDYAVDKGLLWYLAQYLDGDGRLDDDWRRRIYKRSH